MTLLKKSSKIFLYVLSAVILCMVVVVCFLINPSRKENLTETRYQYYQIEEMIYNEKELEVAIEEMSAKNATIFSIYESDTLPEWLIAGWENGSDMGVAYFKYNENQAQYVIKGYESFGGASLYSMTIAEDKNFDHSITIALSRRSDLAEVIVDAGDLHQSKRVSTCPAMVVFEWDEILSDGGGNVDVRFFNAASEELER